MVPFNINHYVWVKLTPHGRECARYRRLTFTEDADGWSRWQLWELMNGFGSDLYMGHSRLPFETDIRIEVTVEEAV
jgi:hypothetical protein